MKKKPEQPAPPIVKPTVCHVCGSKAEYTTDNHGRPSHLGRCRDCYERSVYLEARNDSISRL